MRTIGLALSRGGVRAIAHIGVIKALNENNIYPDVITGAGIASGMSWQQLYEMAYTIFWPGLLRSRTLNSFCDKHFPKFFEQFKLPFAAIATAIPGRKTITITQGEVSPAISASCAIPSLRRPVNYYGYRMIDGGVTCIIPTTACRELGANFVISSDVWEYSSLLRTLGRNPGNRVYRHWYPKNYQRAISDTDLFIQPNIYPICYIPIKLSVDHLIAAGESATLDAIKSKLPLNSKI